MENKSIPPWVSGPVEILNHALYLLNDDSDINRRLSMIIIDNSIEIMLKTYLTLPKRITGLSISKSKFEEFSTSFPRLIEAFELHCPEKAQNINLNEIEFFHRIRNELYHYGIGMTVEKNNLFKYSNIAKNLLVELFHIDIERKKTAFNDNQKIKDLVQKGIFKNEQRLYDLLFFLENEKIIDETYDGLFEDLALNGFSDEQYHSLFEAGLVKYCDEIVSPNKYGSDESCYSHGWFELSKEAEDFMSNYKKE